MRSAYKILSYAIAVLVTLQAAFIAMPVFGLVKWVDDGGVLDKAALEGDESLFAEEIGFMLHGINGQMLIPLIALVLLVISFFAKVPGGAKLAGALLALIVVQVLLGFISFGIPVLGLVHALNAFLILAVSVVAGRRASHPVVTADRTAATV